MQVSGDQSNGLARTDQQGLTALQVTENLFRQTDGRKCHRDRVFADSSIGTHLLGSAERGLKQTPQQRTDGAGFTGNGIRGLHLAENLRLAQHQRVQPRGHAHHVAHGSIILVNIGTGTQLFQAEVMVIGKPGQNTVCREVIMLDIQLAAVARRQDRSLTAFGQTAELLQRLDQLFGGKCHALANVDRGGLMVDTECKEGHSGSQVVT
ncbi:hypothetical protein ALP74_200479 [Pseudomonas coronafaciens pv. garcae]|uniref:Uncharacterized protein n=1 Tax=Pseudomonas coronafaciens pv. garcae TaxID=251653 RepID=A0AB37QJR6_9PSED|nr:hypothetical protein ALP74_200479 [Pseudomonas coronafaciens pv. garcae]